MNAIATFPARKCEAHVSSGDKMSTLAPVAQLLNGLGPSLLWLADRHGRLMAACRRRRRCPWDTADVAAKAVLAGPCKGKIRTFLVLSDDRFGLGFALRLPACAGRAILGGVVGLSAEAEGRLGRLRPALSACGAAAFAAVAAARRAAGLQRQLRQAEKLQTIGRLATGIAHEISAPAQYVRDNTRFLEGAFDKLQSLLAACLQLPAAAADEAATRRLVEELAAAARQSDVSALMREVPTAIDQSLEGIELMIVLLRSMQEFAHPNGTRHVAVDLRHAVETAVAICRAQWKHVAEVVTEFDPQLPAIVCQPDDLHQVLINLMINAAQAIEEKTEEKAEEKHGAAAAPKGTITIRARRQRDAVEICVEDTGTGIAEEIRPRLFDRFFTTKRAGRGTGQGLAIARAIVVGRYGGTINFSTQLGRGTAFIVRLPIAPETVSRENPHDEEAALVC